VTALDGTALLELEAVGFRYGAREVLRSVSLRAEAGEFLAVVGSNGAGKSTLLDLISAYRRAASGRVQVDGRPVEAWDVREFAHRVSHLPQAVHADLPFTAEQLVAMGRYPHTDRWFESEEDHRLIRAAMERTNSWEWRERGFVTLSGGERQRVLLAACLAQQAEILLLDEPSTFLDIDQQLQCFSMLREEAESGRLCVAVTHDLNLALSFCTRLVVLADGVVARDVSVAEAALRPDWLELFSRRLRMAERAGGAPWVWYR
jgi:iron complex transport system ATP-binding protein